MTITVYKVRFWSNYSDLEYGYDAEETAHATDKATAYEWSTAWTDLDPYWHRAIVTKVTTRKRMPKFIAEEQEWALSRSAH